MPIDTVTPNETVTTKKTVYNTNWKRQPTEPRPERNGVLFLRIEVNPNLATIDCRAVEKVGKGKNRQVIFSSNKECKLVFDNNDPVFKKHELVFQGETSLPIDDTVVGWTHCSVDPLDPSKEIPKQFQSPPKIEVP